MTRHWPGRGLAPLGDSGLCYQAGALETNAGGELGDVSADQVKQAGAQSRAGAWKKEDVSINPWI